MKTLVKDLMTYPLVTVPIDSKVAHASELMDRKAINALAVVEIGEKVIVKGIITSTDIRRAPNAHDLVRDHMSCIVEKVSKQQTALSAARRMLNEGVHHLLVTDEGKPIGMLSSIDFVRMLTKENDFFRSRILFV